MLRLAGYLLLAGRVRHSAEETEIISVLESVFRHKIDPHSMFSLPSSSVDSVNNGVLMLYFIQFGNNFLLLFKWQCYSTS